MKLVTALLLVVNELDGYKLQVTFAHLINEASNLSFAPDIYVGSKSLGSNCFSFTIHFRDLTKMVASAALATAHIFILFL